MNKALYLRVNVLNMKVLIGDNIYIFFLHGSTTSRAHPSYTKV